MRICAFIVAIMVITGCGGGYHRVQFSEMPEPPRLTLKNDELIVTTRNKDQEGLSVYKVDINIRESSKSIELRGYQAIGKSEKTEFKVNLSKDQLARISEYRVYWIDTYRKKTRIVLEDDL